MSSTHINILLIERDTEEAARIATLLTDGSAQLPTMPSLKLTHVANLTHARREVTHDTTDLILLSSHTDCNALTELSHIQSMSPAVPVILINGHSAETFALPALRAGAAEYLASNALNSYSLVHAVFHTIERGRIQKQLSESELRYQRLAEHLPDLIYRYRLIEPCGFEYVNAAAERLTGYTPQEHYDDPSLGIKIVHPEDRGLLAAVASGEHPPDEPVVLRWVKKDGSILWCEQRNVIIRALDGTPIAIEGIARDITRRMQAEETLRLHTAALTATANAIVITSASGVIEWVNAAYTQLTGYAINEVIGNTPRVLKSGHHSDAFYQEMWHTIVAGGVWRGEMVNRRKDGTLYQEEQTITPLCDANGHVINFIAIKQDVTIRKLAEQRLLDAERFTRSTLNALTANIAVLDETGTIMAVNQSWIAFAEANGGDPTTTHIGVNYLDVCDRASGADSDVAHAMAAGIRAVLYAEQEVFTLEYQCSSPTEVGWFQAHVSRFDAGGPPSVVIAHEAITTRKVAQAAAARRLTELEAVSRVSTALRTLQTLDTMLPVLLDETLAVLHCTAGAIWLHQPGKSDQQTFIGRGWFEHLQRSMRPCDPDIVSMVFGCDQVHHITEFASDPHMHEYYTDQIPSGWGGICVPIRNAADIVGVLVIAVPAPRQITNEETNLLSVLAEIAGTAMHRVRLHEETVRRLEQLQALRIIDQAITSNQDTRSILNTLLEQTLTQLGVDAAGILLFNPSALTLDYAAGRGFRNHHYQQSHLRLGEGLAGAAALTRQNILVAEICEVSEVARADLFRSEGFASYIGVPFIAKGQLKGVLEVFHREPKHPDTDWLDFLEALAGQAAVAIDNLQLFDGLQRSNVELMLAYDTTIEGWSRALDLRDKETEGHSLRVTDMTMRLARAAGMKEEELVHVRRGTLLHDIGKVGIPDNILLKPGPLTDEEWAVMRQHPQYAYELLAPIEYLRPALDIPYCHHEKWDGSGYPRGLKGEQIPPAARLFAIVDVWDALRSDRPYRQGWPEADIWAHIRSLAGTHFDPVAVELFFQVFGAEPLPRRRYATSRTNGTVCGPSGNTAIRASEP